VTRNLRLIVCGGRNYADREHVFAVLDDIHAKRTIALIIEGDAAGADRLAREWAQERGVPFQTEKPDWIQLGRRGGPARNERMLSLDPDGVVAFPGGRGTADMIRQAEELGYPVMRR
jgi:hypothetical protein